MIDRGASKVGREDFFAGPEEPIASGQHPSAYGTSW
jgi:hypothetical protein